VVNRRCRVWRATSAAIRTAVLERGLAGAPDRLRGVAAVRQTARGGFGGSRRRFVFGFLDDVELEGRALRAEPDDVAVDEQPILLEAHAVHIRAVLAAKILQQEPVGPASDGRVTGRHVEVAFGVEADVGQGVAAEAEEGLAKRLGLSGA
jgi:hypothetical protein